MQASTVAANSPGMDDLEGCVADCRSYLELESCHVAPRCPVAVEGEGRVVGGGGIEVLTVVVPPSASLLGCTVA